MTEFVSSLSALPMPIKAGWIIFTAWSAAQVMWYRRGRAAALPVMQPAAAAPRPAQRTPERRVGRPAVVAAPPLSDDSAAPGSILGLT